MKVKCKSCGLVFGKCLSLGCICPRCGSSFWHRLDSEEKIDKESLEIMSETYNMAKSWLEEKGYVTFKKMGVPTMMEATMKARAKREKEKGLAFEIFDVFNNKKVNVRKIYLNGHIEGFEGDPCIINHAYPKFLKLEAIFLDIAKQMNKGYRDLIERHLIADLPIEEIELSKLYQAQLERIINIKI